ARGVAVRPAAGVAVALDEGDRRLALQALELLEAVAIRLALVDEDLPALGHAGLLRRLGVLPLAAEVVLACTLAGAAHLLPRKSSRLADATGGEEHEGDHGEDEPLLPLPRSRRETDRGGNSHGTKGTGGETPCPGCPAGPPPTGRPPRCAGVGAAAPSGSVAG